MLKKVYKKEILEILKDHKKNSTDIYMGLTPDEILRRLHIKLYGEVQEILDRLVKEDKIEMKKGY